MTTRGQAFHWKLLASILFAVAPSAISLQGQSLNSANDQPKPVTWMNLEFSTGGGKQFWTDLVHFHGYRIQKNVLSGHHRLLSPSDKRLAWGNFPGCEEELERIAAGKNLQPVKGKIVIVLHGLSRTRSSMQPLSDFIAAETGMQVINMSYASGRDSIEAHAAALESVIRHLPEVDEISFVGHSMGNIVIRYYLGTRGNDPRFRRMVMLGPPNHGSALAAWLKNNLIFRAATGSAGQQLAAPFDQIGERLATPAFEFAIIAGATGSSGGISNPLVPGDNDLIVAVDETRLAGATDFLSGDFWHSTIMKNASVQRATVNFLQNGHLLSAEQRNPIPATSLDPSAVGDK